MVKLGELRKNSIERLKRNKIEEARADTDFLLFFLLGADKEDILKDTKIIDDEDEKKFYDALERRIKGEPVQYIAGRCEFYSMEFEVDENTLIPRADTEILVDECIKLVKEKNLKKVLDIGTGSGCIGISILKSCPEVLVCMLDVSEGALEIAKKNAENLGVLDRATFMKKDILNAEPDEFEKFDLVVSNPPYIETETVKNLDDKVKNYEPESALDGGEDGLVFYRKITSVASKNSDYLLFEIGYNQGETVNNIMEEYFKDISLVLDYASNPRVLIGKNSQI